MEKIFIGDILKIKLTPKSFDNRELWGSKIYYTIFSRLGDNSIGLIDISTGKIFSYGLVYGFFGSVGKEIKKQLIEKTEGVDKNFIVKELITLLPFVWKKIFDIEKVKKFDFEILKYFRFKRNSSFMIEIGIGTVLKRIFKTSLVPQNELISYYILALHRDYIYTDKEKKVKDFSKISLIHLKNGNSWVSSYKLDASKNNDDIELIIPDILKEIEAKSPVKAKFEILKEPDFHFLNFLHQKWNK